MIWEQYEITKGVTGSRKSKKNRQNNGRKISEENTNNAVLV